MSAASDPAASRRRSNLVRGRVANLPRPADVRAFSAALRSRHRRTALRALWDGFVVTVVLRRRGVRPLIAPAAAVHLTTDRARAAEVAEAVDAGLGLLPLAATCLRRSLVLLRELRRLGLGGTLQVGVRQREGRSEAHAWVEVDAVVINDDPTLVATYRPFPSGEVERLLPMLP